MKLGVNLHLYPSYFTNESRILREAHTLGKLEIFDSIDLVGVHAGDLPMAEELADNVSIYRLQKGQKRKSLFGKFFSIFTWSWAVYKNYNKKNVTCINCHSVSVLPLACLLKWKTKARLVYDAHELETETNGLRGGRKIMTKIVERLMISQADECIFVGEEINKWYIKTYRLINTHVIYNCPALTVSIKTDYFRNKFNIGSDIPIFIYQGLIGKGRGIEELVTAFSTLPAVALVIMGYGPLSEWVQEQIASIDNIFYHEAVPPSNLLQYTASADFGVSLIQATSLSYEFCMPNKLFEYLMAGLPVLVSPTKEQSRFVSKYGVGVCTKSFDPADVREAVLSLIAHDRSSLASNVHAARIVNCWERQEDILMHIYMERLGFKRREHISL